MKKIITILLAILVLMLASCGKKTTRILTMDASSLETIECIILDMQGDKDHELSDEMFAKNVIENFEDIIWTGSFINITDASKEEIEFLKSYFNNLEPDCTSYMTFTYAKSDIKEELEFEDVKTFKTPQEFAKYIK